MRRLRRGLYPIEDELDLHGLNQTAARDHLAEFLARSRDGGCRCVRIIHGKAIVRAPGSGAQSGGESLAAPAYGRHGLRSARAIDGGAGAVYVLLRA